MTPCTITGAGRRSFVVLGQGGYDESAVSHWIPHFDKQLAYDLLALDTLKDVQRELAARLR